MVDRLLFRSLHKLFDLTIVNVSLIKLIECGACSRISREDCPIPLRDFVGVFGGILKWRIIRLPEAIARAEHDYKSDGEARPNPTEPLGRVHVKSLVSNFGA